MLNHGENKVIVVFLLSFVLIIVNSREHEILIRFVLLFILLDQVVHKESLNEALLGTSTRSTIAYVFQSLLSCPVMLFHEIISYNCWRS
jgi:ABC-type iron transport system FetAB permease component